MDLPHPNNAIIFLALFKARAQNQFYAAIFAAIIAIGANMSEKPNLRIIKFGDWRYVFNDWLTYFPLQIEQLSQYMLPMAVE